jgi:hypothetical protein
MEKNKKKVEREQGKSDSFIYDNRIWRRVVRERVCVGVMSSKMRALTLQAAINLQVNKYFIGC